MPRAWVWLQVLAGWLPVWALYTGLIVVAHGPISLTHAALIATRGVLPAALLGILVYRLARRVPWPRPFRARFALLHLVAAPAYGLAWLLVSSIIESVVHRHVMMAGPGVVPFMMLGAWLYVIVAGISYAVDATARAARAEAIAARTELAALRAQLQPHFLFNALHAVVQLIPSHPARAQEAAELVAALLRRTMDEDRDLVSLADEWAFVTRYLELERMRFGDRLRVSAVLDESVLDAAVPSFALQTLVENAVRHGAAPRAAPTEITVTAAGTRDEITLIVRDTGNGAAGSRVEHTGGTGLVRLRERLGALYGGASRLVCETAPGAGWSATLVIPRADAADA